MNIKLLKTNLIEKEIHSCNSFEYSKNSILNFIKIWFFLFIQIKIPFIKNRLFFVYLEKKMKNRFLKEDTTKILKATIIELKKRQRLT